MHLEGGCLCGSVRYRINGDPSTKETPCLCHCRTCQLSSGAPLVAWATFARVHPRSCTWAAPGNDVAAFEANPTAAAHEQDSFELTTGKPQEYFSTPQGMRQFCGLCGTQLTFQTVSREVLHITLVSLDTSDVLQPEDHFWTASKRAYMRTDDLPSCSEIPDFRYREDQ